MIIDTNDIGDTVLDNQSKQLDEWFNKRFDERLQAHMEELNANKTPKLSIMVTKGTLDWAYPPFIIASTASALGWEVTMFFTFYGLSLLKKEISLQISPLGNPAMPMKMPFGPSWFRDIEWKMPNIIMAGVPGFQRLASSLMKKTLKDKGVATITELREICIDSEIKMIGCQMTVDLFGWKREDFIPEITEWAGAASYLSITREADTNLFT